MTLAGMDLRALDARIARAERATSQILARLRTKEERDDARRLDPFADVRDVTGQSLFRELSSADVSPVEAPHRDALRRWVHELLQARIGWELVLDEADARSERDPKLSLAANPSKADGVLSTYEEARRALVEASSLRATEEALERMSAQAGPVAAARLEQRARRFEASKRLGLEHPWALATQGSVAALTALAQATLDGTEALSQELAKERRRRFAETAGTAAMTPAVVMVDAHARDASEGWPAKVTGRWFEEIFRAVAPRSRGAVELPRSLGGASFLRAARAWGSDLRLSAVARSLPYALARDPYPTEAFLVGDAFAITLASPLFAKRKLGLPARMASAHARALHRVLFAELRRLAADVLLGARHAVEDDLVEELTTRLCGRALPPLLARAFACGGFAGNTRIVAPARFVSALRAALFVRSLVERFDEDWFDNPRAGVFLATIGSGPVWSGDVPEASAVASVIRASEEALG
jgi:hypothetical protein